MNGSVKYDPTTDVSIDWEWDPKDKFTSLRFSQKIHFHEDKTGLSSSR
jgi:hypothetical protein